MSYFWSILLIVLGFVLLIKGAEFFIDGSAGLARRLKISNFVIGLTLVALGTSFPELTVSVIAGISGGEQLAIGNIVGSNIVNIALILGLCGLLRQVEVKSDTLVKYDLPFVILASVVLLILGFDRYFQNNHVNFDRLTLGDGFILLIFLVIFLYYIYGNLKSVQAMEQNVEQIEKEQSKESVLKLVLYIAGGLLALVGGGKIAVDNAIILAGLLGASQTIIGLTIVAIGTSLPEAVTTIMAVIKKKEEIAIGNIIGSNVLNIFLILGIVSVISPLELPSFLVIDMLILLALSILLFVYIFFRRKLDKYLGFFLLSSYIAYFVFIYMREVLTIPLAYNL
jgi:cation:H+ antiporter